MRATPGIFAVNGVVNGRGRGIRTLDILLPKQARYQAALYPECVQTPALQLAGPSL